MRSMVARISVTASLVAGKPSRNLPIRVSAACASASSRGRPMKPQVPLMVWTRRKMLSRILALFGILLETHELDVDDVETLVGLGHEFPQQVVHGNAFTRRALARPPLPVGSAVSVSGKRLILVAEWY